MYSFGFNRRNRSRFGFDPVYNPVASDFVQRRGTGSFRELETCQMPPPCMEGYSQFRMPGTNSMCCRRTPARAPTVRPTVTPTVRRRTTVRKAKKCKAGKVRCRATGRCVVRKNARRCGVPRARSKFDNAIRILKDNYSSVIKGKHKSPPYITNRKKVNGKNTAEKIANIRRVLSTCKRAGVRIFKVDRNGNPTGFKAFSTLVNQCNIRFSRESDAGSVLSDAKGPRPISSIASLWRAKAARRAAEQREELNRTFEIARNTPLPDDADLNELDFGRSRSRSRFGRIRFG